MSYVWGSKPTDWTTVEVENVSSDYVFQKGERGSIHKWNFETQTGLSTSELLDDSTIAQRFMSQMKQKGAIVKYISISHTDSLQGGYVDRYIRTYTMQECYFVGDPIPVFVILGIIALIALLVWLFAPVLKKWAGLSPIEDILYTIGPLLTLGGIIIVLVVAVPMIQDFMKRRKNKR